MKKRRIMAYNCSKDGVITTYGYGSFEANLMPDIKAFGEMPMELFRLDNGKRVWEWEVLICDYGKRSDQILKKAKSIKAKEWPGTSIFPVSQPITGIEIK